MEKECCKMRVSETDDGIKIEINGKDIKDRCKVFMEKCCDEKSVKTVLESCCGEGSAQKIMKSCCKD